MRRRLLALRPQEGAQALANTARLLVHKRLDTSIAPAMPVLVATGEHDHFTTPDLCREVAATCVDSWFTTIADADHMVPFERSAEIVDLATRFFADQPLTGLSYCPSLALSRGGLSGRRSGKQKAPLTSKNEDCLGPCSR
jgi:hypothetical protein